MKRRGFMRVLGAAGVALGLVRYAEPLLDIPDAAHDWIEDRGDFYVVRVPDFKSFDNEHLDKPTIFLLGEMALVRRVYVDSFANIHAPRGGTVAYSQFDASTSLSQQARAVLTLKGEGLTVEGNTIVSGQNSSACLQFLPGKYQTSKPLVYNAGGMLA